MSCELRTQYKDTLLSKNKFLRHLRVTLIFVCLFITGSDAQMPKKVTSLKTLQAHSQAISAIAVSPDNRLLVTASQDKTAKVWNIASGRAMFTLQGHNDGLCCVAFSSDSKLIATAGHDKTAKIWNAATGQEITTLVGHRNAIYTVVFSTDGKRLITGGDQGVRIWNTTTWEESSLPFVHRGRVTNAYFFGNNMILTLSGNLLQCWEIAAHRVKWDTAWPQETNCLAVSSDGMVVARSTLAGEVFIKDTLTPRIYASFITPHIQTFSAMFSSDGKRLLIGSADKSARVWNTSNGHQMLALQEHDDRVTAVAFFDYDTRIATADAQGVVKIWDATQEEEVMPVPNPPGKKITKKHEIPVKAIEDPLEIVRFCAKGSRIVTAGRSPEASLLDAQTGKKLFSLKGHKSRILCLAASGDGQKIASAGEDRTVQIWNAQSGERLLVIPTGHERPIEAIAFFPDGKRLITTSQDKTVQVWDTENGVNLAFLLGHQDGIKCVAVSPDGLRFVTVSNEGTAKIWDSVSQKEVLSFHILVQQPQSVVFSADGKSIYTSTRHGTVLEWNASTGRLVRKIRRSHGYGTHAGMILTDDGKKLLTWGGIYAIVWNLETGQESARIQGWSDETGYGWNSMNLCDLSPDGSRFITIRLKRSLEIWELGK